MYYILIIIISITSKIKNNNNKTKINNNNIIENKNNLPINNNKHNINNKYLSSFSLTNYFISYSSIDDLPNNHFNIFL